MNSTYALQGCPIFDGHTVHYNCALIVSCDTIHTITKENTFAAHIPVHTLTSGILVPGFVDLQVNGGGGMLFNDNPTPETIATICATHARLGTTSLMPTLITDTVEKTHQAIEAAYQAQQQRIPGFVGLHLEGPHLSQEKKGVHNASLIRTMDQTDVQTLVAASSKIHTIMVTVAPESVTNQQIQTLTKAGIIVSIGHTNATYNTVKKAVDAGATCVTHIFNAMSPLRHRDPGAVGAALTMGNVYAGLIADGIHVDAKAIQIALAAKNGPAKIFLVSDAMAIAGTQKSTFFLGDTQVFHHDNKLVLADGTLAGADLDIATAVQFMTQKVGVTLPQACNMGALNAAMCLGISEKRGHLQAGAIADIVHLDQNLFVTQVWQSGVRICA